MLKRRIAETALNVILKHISEETIKDIKYDVTRGKNGIRKNYTDQLLKEKIIYNEPFRNVFFWRVEGDKEYKYRKWLRLWNRMLKVLYPPADSIEIFAKKIGGGIYLPHKYCVINAKTIGENVVIMQGVTVGKGVHGGKPIIGDNVILWPNSVVAGNIVVGDNSWIGANSFVNCNVPPNSTVRTAKSNLSSGK